jgi:hypothetical protein
MWEPLASSLTREGSPIGDFLEGSHSGRVRIFGEDV